MALTTRQRIDATLAAQGREDAFPGAYLDMVASDAEGVICRYRQTTVIEESYLSTAASIGMYWIEKLGYNGAVSMSENGVSRSYETGDIPDSLLRLIVPSAVVV